MLGFLCCFAAPTHSRAQATAVVEGQAHAKGVVLLRAELPSLKCPSDWSIQVAMDDGNFVDPGFGLHRGKRLLTLMEDQHGCVVNEVAFTAAGDLGPMAFVFASPGTYQLRWLIGSVESHSADFIIDQQIRVYAPRQGDLTFLRRVGNPAFLRHLFGDDFFERKGEGKRKELLSPAGADARALFVVAELLEATRARDPGEVVRPRKSIENALKWADALLPLAQEFPESSYAPYAAYYAGCCYFAAGGDVLEKTMKERRIQDSSLTPQKLQELAAEPEAASHQSKAEEAFALAINRADAYLKPRAIYMRAGLVGMRGEWDEMERLLDRASAEAPGEGTIQRLVDRARRGLAKAKQRKEQENSERKEE